MKFSDGWLVEHGVQDLERIGTLQERGLCVTLVEDRVLGANFKIARVVSIDRHPQADRLRVCTVDDGSVFRQVVCGDPGLVVGQVTVLAVPGARLPCGRMVGVSRLRGVQSEGMLCSLAELGLAPTASGVVDLVREYGGVVAERIGQAAYCVLQPDGRVWDAEVPFNRPDLLCVAGLARELGVEASAEGTTSLPLMMENRLRVNFQNTEGWFVVLCEARVGNVTPDYIKRRISLRGCMPRTYPVDLTNYVLYEVGHPMHAFDADRIEGALVMRRAVAGEMIELLSGEVATIDAGTVIFADDLGPVSIAGVMGGARTKCDHQTERVLFEATWLGGVPEGIESDAYKVFSRGADRLGPRRAMCRLLELVSGSASLPGGLVSGSAIKAPVSLSSDARSISAQATATAEFGLPQLPAHIKYTEAAITSMVGVRLDHAEYLRRSGCAVVSDGGGFDCCPPSWRTDLRDVPTLAAEVARVYGYHKLPVVKLLKSGVMLERPSDVREILLGLGLQEVLSNHLTVRGQIRPPRAKTTKGLRQCLVAGVWEHCKQQLRQRAVQWSGMFEVGACFMRCAEGVADFRAEVDGVGVAQVRRVGVVCNPEVPRWMRGVGVEEVALALQSALCLRFTSVGGYVEGVNGSGICLNGDGGVSMWVGVLDPAWTESTTKRPVYALECVLPENFAYPGRREGSSKHCSQAWRDVTFVYPGEALALSLMLRNSHRGSQIECIDEYKDAVTFRIYMDSVAEIDAVVAQYVTLAESCGACLQDTMQGVVE